MNATLILDQMCNKGYLVNYCHVLSKHVLHIKLHNMLHTFADLLSDNDVYLKVFLSDKETEDNKRHKR